MSRLSEFLVNSIVNEQTTALFGGGFKPPTKGHLEVVLQGLKENPKVNKLIIAVGRKPRGGITQDQSVQIWEIYKRLIPVETEIVSVVSPFNFYKTFLKENKEDDVYVFIGARKNNKKDIIDIKERSKFVKRYSDNVIPKSILTENGDSGTNSRKLLKENLEEFYHTLPTNLTEEEKFQIHLILENEKLKKYVDKVKTNFKKFISALKQEKQETKDAFKLLTQAVKGEKQLSKEEKKQIGNQMKDVLKVAGLTAASVLPGGVVYLLLTKVPALKKSLTPSAFNKVDESMDFISLEKKLDDLFYDLDIDVNFTKHFKERVLQRNLSEEDILDLAKKIINKYEDRVTYLDKNENVVFTHLSRLIDIAVVSAGYGEDFLKDLVFKTAFKRNSPSDPEFRTSKSSPKLKVNEASEDKILYAFDLDDTLITSKSDVIVTNPERGTFKLTPAEYALYEPGPNDEFDFSEFKYLKSPKVIKDNFELFSKILEKSSQLSGAKTIILTARQPEVATDLEAFLEKKNLPQITLHAVGSSDPNDKLKVIKDYINQGFNKIRFYDDSPKNVQAIRSIDMPGVDVVSKLVKHGPLSEILAEINDLMLESTLKDNSNITLTEDDPKTGTGKKPKGSSRRLYTDEDPKDTVGIKFSTRQDIVDTLNKKSFKAKSHARQSQIINLIHQRTRAAYNRAKKPDVKKRLKTALDYIEKRKEASKKKTQRLKKQKSKNENIDPKSQAKHKGKSAPFGSAYEPLDEAKQVGTLYHYTSKEALQKILNSNSLIPSQESKFDPKHKDIPQNTPFISFTRANPKTANFNISEDADYVIILDGDKLSNKYKIVPFQDYDVDGGFIDEMEERIYNRTITNLDNYIIDIKNLKLIKKPTSLNENTTYSNHIDYRQEIKDLTKHMIKKGMNILPLPKVVFKHGDQENAKKFLGKTAYYMPDSMTIVLYTEGRHPKDVVRSFSHEMVHHVQNLEDRLEGINTTNTLEDDHLNNIEREAYSDGNMMFRNWTDGKDGEEVTSLNEGKQVGDLYHFTNLKGILGILENGYIKGSPKGLSTTRDKDLDQTSKFYNFKLANSDSEYSGLDAKIILDGDKISNNYKITPTRDIEFSTTKKKKYRKKGDKWFSMDEREELINTKKLTLIPYVKEIIVSTDDHVYEWGKLSKIKNIDQYKDLIKFNINFGKRLGNKILTYREVENKVNEDKLLLPKIVDNIVTPEYIENYKNMLKNHGEDKKVENYTYFNKKDSKRIEKEKSKFNFYPFELDNSLQKKVDSLLIKTLTESQKSTLSLKDSFEPQKENYKFDCNCG